MSSTFQDLGLSETTLSAVERMGFTAPTPVQEQAIPLVLEGRDVVAAATTGTGKTAAFALPLFERIGRAKRPGSPRALVVSPTRELAQQIDAACTQLAKASNRRMLTVMGGTKYKGQIAKLDRGIDVLVATPGRLYDLMERGVVKLRDVEVLVLDEADRMLDMGFWPTMKKVVAATPSSRQTLLFSATLDRKVMQSVSSILKDPAFVEVSHKGETADTIDQFMIPVGPMKKPELLRLVLQQRGSKRVIVFTDTKTRAEICTGQLKRAGFRADSIHSDKTQVQRKRALEGFSKGAIDVLVATDVLARGIDVSNIEYVVNYDLPESPEDYVHRIGRTGRAGETGYAISFVSPEAKAQLLDIEKLLGERIPTLDIDGYDATEAEKALASQFVPKATVGCAAFSRSLRRTGGRYASCVITGNRSAGSVATSRPKTLPSCSANASVPRSRGLATTTSSTNAGSGTSHARDAAAVAAMTLLTLPFIDPPIHGEASRLAGRRKAIIANDRIRHKRGAVRESTRRPPAAREAPAPQDDQKASRRFSTPCSRDAWHARRRRCRTARGTGLSRQWRGR